MMACHAGLPRKTTATASPAACCSVRRCGA